MRRPAVLFLRDAIRTARAAALANVEAVGPLFVAIDQLGKFLNPSGFGLGEHRRFLRELARESALYQLDPLFHVDFESLFSVVVAARNDAMHQGVYARHLTHHALELALVLEDALMAECSTVGDFMIRSPVTAEMWHPISFVRQNMVENSFTYLPIRKDGEWHLIADHAVATALRGAPEPIRRDERSRRLALSVEQSLQEQLLPLTEPGYRATPDENVFSVLACVSDGRMIVVVDPVRPGGASRDDRLLGILMPFDLL